MIASLFITTGIHRGALHGDGVVTGIDAERLSHFLAQNGASPTAVLPGLVWRV